MAEVYDMKQIDGDIHQMYPQTCPATVMIGMFTCCTMKIGEMITRPAAMPAAHFLTAGLSPPSRAPRVHEQGHR
jgi:hypothetical protein